MERISYFDHFINGPFAQGLLKSFSQKPKSVHKEIWVFDEVRELECNLMNKLKDKGEDGWDVFHTSQDKNGYFTVLLKKKITA